MEKQSLGSRELKKVISRNNMYRDRLVGQIFLAFSESLGGWFLKNFIFVFVLADTLFTCLGEFCETVEWFLILVV